jgi:hypothetical protein
VTVFLIVIVGFGLLFLLAWVCSGKPTYDDNALLRPHPPEVESEEETLTSD